MRSLVFLAAWALACPGLATAQQPPAAPAPAEPPVGVLILPSGEVTAEMAEAVRELVVSALAPHAPGREVRALTNEQRLIAVLQCPDAPCIGGQLAELGAIAGVLVRIARAHARDPVTVTLEVVDPVSGAPRLEPVRVELTEEQARAPREALAPALARLAEVMPPAPPASSLLVAVNVDEATVTVDGEEIGTTPVGPVAVTPGRHVVAVRRAGFTDASRSIEVGRGEDARVDLWLDLDPTSAVRHGLDGEEGVPAGPSDPWYTRWYVITGAGVVVAAILLGVVIAIASSGGEQRGGGGIPVPPIE